MVINFKEEVLKHKDNLLDDLFDLLSIESNTDGSFSEEAPFGLGPRKALDKILSFGKRDGYLVKNVGNVAGHIEIGQGEELFGVLGHVDVVPANPKEWISHPFKPEIRDGKIFARGVLDDKGPTMAAYYAIKLLNELGVTWTKRVRLIVGTDEEVGFRCVDRYFQTEERPDLGFTPDAHFPIINGEKARATFSFNLKFKEEDQAEFKLLSLKAGLAQNMVPSTVTAELKGDSSKLKEKLITYGYEEYLIEDGEVIKLTFKGKAAHGSTPELGINAATKLADFMLTLGLDINARNYFEFISTYLHDDPIGKKLGLEYSDSEMGHASFNYGIFKYDLGKQIGKVETDSRYPAKYNLVDKIEDLSFENMQVILEDSKEAHFIPKEDELVQTLLSVYRKYTGDVKNEPMVIGGGTYARCMRKAVAFGVLLPDREDTMHQANEYMFVEDLLLSTAIFAESIYRICCKQG
ncbi:MULTISPECIES: dipeptidase PepV [unclassified Gemella]|uniref:dipeptidase PepV n=1 Tax=unclassified Gemella TaxID=2624949 RepID=UPI0010735B5B|nr:MULTISPECIES: dipeptidase PepV [unclassified Gemella]MBF0710824.1 dipeptidase PepV [Gemella sp. GL1.1]MBF0746082.1 dipeptidase PepV [Gemella sp. 19428wG2_WT2a]NYS28168.1 dipeptidase PepV [Gemella sp. GL1]TFU60373.1 dipeptidase PepV [Gemella sp. WT2a]